MTNSIWICEDCGELSPDTCCQHCPVGTPGVDVATIKRHIGEAPTHADVNDAAKQYGPHWRILMQSQDRNARAMGIQIKNLGWYRRRELDAA